MPTTPPTPCMTLAALVYDDSVDPAPVLKEVVARLRKRGVAMAGAIQHGDSACSMALELLPSGTHISISQNLGNGARGCRLDTAALAEAASVVRKSVDASPALAVFNKFGALEAAGQGLFDEMALAITTGVPVMTAVRNDLLEKWMAFTGGESVQLACCVDAALAWWDALASS